MEMQGLRPFRDITVEEFLSEAQKDFDVIHSRVLETFGSRIPGIGQWSFRRARLIRSCRLNLQLNFFLTQFLRFTKRMISQESTSGGAQRHQVWKSSGANLRIDCIGLDCFLYR